MLDFVRNISPTELIVIGVILTFLFGSKILIALGKSSGETLREMRRIKDNFTEAVEDDKPHKTEKEVAK